MRTRLTLVSAVVVGLFAAMLPAGCQTYDFEPVEPLALSQTTKVVKIEARVLKPNLMLLVDKSGSMTFPVDPSLAACRLSNGTTCGGQAECPQSCPTRWRQLQAAMSSFLTSSGTTARMGLAFYPSDPVCGSTTAVVEALPTADDTATLQTKATAINTAIQAIKNFDNGVTQPQGGTPTGASLNYVGSLAELKGTEREDFVLLLTDGLPNCNGALNGNTCACTTGVQADCQGEPRLCLDQTASVQAVQALKANSISTFVIGFGAETGSSGGSTVLNAMAEAGGYPRGCQSDADCGTGDTCNTTAKLCGKRYYQAANQTELVEALRKISERIPVDNACLIQLDASQMPSDPSLVVIYMEGVRVESTENGVQVWEVTANGILFKGPRCDQILASTPNKPVNIEVRAVQRR